VPFVAVNKARRKRHQDRPGNRAQSAAWRIESKHSERIRRAFADAMRELYTPEAIDRLAEAIEAQQSSAAGEDIVVDLLDADRLARRIEPAYRDLIADTTDHELRAVGVDTDPYAEVSRLTKAAGVRRVPSPRGEVRFEVDGVGGFVARREGKVWRVFGAGGMEAANASPTLRDVERKLRNLRPATVTAAGTASTLDAGAATGIPLTTSSVAGLAFAQARTARLIAEVTEAERQRVNQIIAREFLGGRRVVRADIRDKIKSTVGLLSSEERRVHVAYQEALGAGLGRRAAQKVRENTAAKLLNERGRRVARTETNFAQNEGKKQAWDRARTDGALPEGTLKTWIAASESERTCRICGSPPDAPDGLDRQQVPLNEPFFSELVGEIDRPPAHPNCRCTMTLAFPEES